MYAMRSKIVSREKIDTIFVTLPNDNASGVGIAVMLLG